MGQPIGGDAERPAGRGMYVDLSAAELLDGVVVAMRDPDVDAGAGAGEVFGRNPRVFQGTPGDLQQQPLLRIHHSRFPGGDSEEAGIEAGNVVQQARSPGSGLSRGAGLRIIDRRDVPAIRGDIDDRIADPARELPQRLSSLHPARQRTCHADYGDPVAQIRGASVSRHTLRPNASNYAIRFLAALPPDLLIHLFAWRGPDDQ